ncbi:MFS transporter [Purpureocillium lilacinum]|uniref:MFS transporter n=1 Tax=Purpureocillium lilacinum TaxID=33203 RepID=A0A179GR78_PURLI|nr:MFS transporter [Purpureocillium lilacinum]
MNASSSYSSAASPEQPPLTMDPDKLEAKIGQPGDDDGSFQRARNPDGSSLRGGEDILGLQDLDPVLNMKMHLVNNAIDEIGWTPYHLKLFFLNGFGYAVDSMILLFQSIVSTQAYREFGESGYKNALTVSVYCGMLTGAVFWGCTADLIGRKYAFNISLFMCSVCCIVAGAMPSWASLGLFIALLGFGGGGNLIMDTTVFLEYLPSDKQWLLTFLACWWGFGQAITGFIGWGFLVPARWNCADVASCTRDSNWGWRYTLFTGGALVLVMSILRVTVVRLRETPKYQLSMGEDAELVETFQFLAQKYNRPCSLTLEKLEACGTIRSVQKKKKGFSVAGTWSHFSGLFAIKKIGISTGMIWLSWTLIGLAYPLFYVFLPTYLANRGLEFHRSQFETWRNYAITNICGIPGPIIAGFMCNTKLLGRKYTMVIGALITMAFFFAYTAVKTAVQDLTFTCLIACFLNIYYGTLYAYTPEVLPSAHRGTGNGIAVACNRVMGIVSAIVATFADTSTSAPLYVCATIFLAAAIVAALFPFEPYGRRSSGSLAAASKSPSHEEEPDSGSRVASEKAEDKLVGPMARRLAEATEEALLTGGAAGRRAVEDAGFSEELKERLLNKIADAKFRKQYSGAFAEAGIGSAAGEGTKHIAAAQPWTGTEATEDAVLRMLDDGRKPLKPQDRGKYQPPPVDMRLKRGPVQSPGQRAASARERASMYTGLGMKGSKGLSDEEREEMKREFRERFRPGARSMPVSPSGLAALANERIENAIARGQFKDLPRGKSMERDPRADNPFIDTTEYIMNRMIQRQDIAPPWIEKQQELSKAARVFRERLRNDWKRHAARMIASHGGSLEQQMKRAQDHAAAEQLHNPRQMAVEQIAVPSNSTDHPVMAKLRERAPVIGEELRIAEEHVPRDAPLPPPFRDADWERAEAGYMKLSIDNLNSIARSYNLMAPDLAKKPYFSLQRELAACYADVAPLLAEEIKQRAVGRSTTATTRIATSGGGGFMGQLAGRDAVKIHLEADEKAYGLKEWWRDFWKKE